MHILLLFLHNSSLSSSKDASLSLLLQISLQTLHLYSSKGGVVAHPDNHPNMFLHTPFECPTCVSFTPCSSRPPPSFNAPTEGITPSHIVPLFFLKCRLKSVYCRIYFCFHRISRVAGSSFACTLPLCSLACVPAHARPHAAQLVRPPPCNPARASTRVPVRLPVRPHAHLCTHAPAFSDRRVAQLTRAQPRPV